MHLLRADNTHHKIILRSGQVTDVYTSWLIALLYHLIGYWGAVLFLPALYVLLCFLGFRKIASLKREVQEE